MNNLHVTQHINNLIEAAGFIKNFTPAIESCKSRVLHKRLIDTVKEFTDLV